MTDRELDALVAEKVFLYRLEKVANGYATGIILGPSGTSMSVPNYSTDIATAFRVLEELPGLKGIGYGPARKDWTAYFQINIDHPTHRASDKSAPRAICLAALLAVGVDAL